MQVLYTLMAFMMVTYLTIQLGGDQRSVAQRMVAGEVELVGLGIAEGLLDALGAESFDNIDTSTLDALLTASHAPLSTLPDSLTQAPASTTTTRPLRVNSSQGTVDFEVDLQVRYVTRQGNGYATSASATGYKEAAITMTGPLQATIVLSRIYTDA